MRRTVPPMSTSESIGAYLRSLAADTDKLVAFLADPASALTESGLQQWQRDLLERGNLDEVREALIAEGEPLDANVLTVIWP